MTQTFPHDMSVGLIAMSAKPVHRGHHELIIRASHENDAVIVYVSTSDRQRRGEFTVRGDTMRGIWHDYIEATLPSNVEVEYGGSPVGKVYAQLGAENERLTMGDIDVATFIVYGCDDDVMANFPEENLQKYAYNLLSMGLIQLRKNVRLYSGEQMRRHIKEGDVQTFKANLPDPLDDAAREDIWRRLRGG
jgi:hypothetical protein